MIAIRSIGNFCSCRNCIHLKMARLHIKANYAVYGNCQAVWFLNREIRTRRGWRESKNTVCLKESDWDSTCLELVHFFKENKGFSPSPAGKEFSQDAPGLLQACNTRWFQLVVALTKLATQRLCREIWLQSHERHWRPAQWWVGERQDIWAFFIIYHNGVTSRPTRYRISSLLHCL